MKLAALVSKAMSQWKGNNSKLTLVTTNPSHAYFFIRKIIQCIGLDISGTNKTGFSIAYMTTNLCFMFLLNNPYKAIIQNLIYPLTLSILDHVDRTEWKLAIHHHNALVTKLHKDQVFRVLYYHPPEQQHQIKPQITRPRLELLTEAQQQQLINPPTPSP